MKGILFEEKVMYILYFKSYKQECSIIIINISRISLAFFQDIYFLQKGKLVLRSLLSEGRYLGGGGGWQHSGFANTCDILSLLSKVRYFRGVVTFGTLRQLVNTNARRTLTGFLVLCLKILVILIQSYVSHITE